MRRDQHTTGREFVFPTQANLITTTDKRGVITYVNQDFIDVSGYSREELIGKNHNLIRHPDMPAQAFKDMWATIESHRSWRGAVKNRCKNGDHYWVDAYVTPILKDGELIEYQSIRTALGSEQKQRAEQLYQHWKQGSAARFIATSPYRFTRVLQVIALSGVLCSAAVAFSSNVSWSWLALLAPLILSAGLVYLSSQCSALLALAGNSGAHLAMTWIYRGKVDIKSRLAFAISTLRQENRALMARLVNSTFYLSAARQHACAAMQTASTQSALQHQSTDAFLHQLMLLRTQQSQIDTAAADMTALTAASEDIACAGHQQLQQMLDISLVMREQLAQLSSRFHEVNQQGNTIAKVVQVIREVAEQTNLLALNAAIEAARAGEQGRGFAVVADEIRALASRTQHSTHEIQTIIADLYQGIQQAGLALKAGVGSAEQTERTAMATAAGIEQIKHSIEEIRTKASSISAATKQQLHTVEQLNEETGTLARLAGSSATAADEAQQQGQLLALQLTQLSILAQHFLNYQQKAEHYVG